MQKDGDIAGGAGGVTFAVLLALVPFYWSARSPLLLGIMICLFIGSGACGLYWLHARAAASRSRNQVSVGGDDSGTQFAIGRDMNFFLPPALEPSAVATNTSTVPIAEKKEAPQYRLQLLEPRNAILSFDEGAGSWLEGREGQQGIVIPVLNSEAPLGGQAAKARKIAVILELRSEHDAYKARVTRAYWLSNYSNQATFEIGDTKEIVIGVSCGEEWHSYQNPRPAMTSFNHFGAPNTYAELDPPRCMPKGSEMKFAITLISDSGETLLRQDFRTRFIESEKWYTEAL
jgi:hypothetical protein